MDDNTPNPIQSLYEAALQGDVSLLRNLLGTDPLLLHRPIPSTVSDTSPLHVACKLGRTDFVSELLLENPNLMEELDPNDKSSLLHLAARNGHLQLVKSLVRRNPSLCVARDIHGRTPIHLAAIKGQIYVLEELLKTTPDAAKERVGLSLNTIMHLCVKYNHPHALIMAVRLVGDAEMLNATNAHGDTVLHVAVANKRLEIVEFLLRDRRVKKNTLNSNEKTAMDIFKESPKEVNNRAYDQLKTALKREKVLRSEEMKKEREKDKHLDWLEKQRSALMVVASLIATMAFAGGINPPGGVWQDDGNTTQLQQSNTPASSPASSTTFDSMKNDSHDPGTSIMALQHPYPYENFFFCNTVGFLISMSSILLLIGGLPCRRLFMAVIMVTMWVAISAMTLAYGFATFNLIPDKTYSEADTKVARIFLRVWVGVTGLLLLWHIIQWPVRFIKHLCKCCASKCT